MRAVSVVEGIAAPMASANVDTDQILPKQFLKTITRHGLGAGLFYDERHDLAGVPKPGFVLDRFPYDRAEILVAGDNFGCGSSREHAPWALADFGIRSIISTSFADIFFNNSINNGLLLAIVSAADLAALMADAENAAGPMRIDLANRTITTAGGYACAFLVDEIIRTKLMQGRDAIDDTLQHEGAIAGVECALEAAMPWLPRREIFA